MKNISIIIVSLITGILAYQKCKERSHLTRVEKMNIYINYLHNEEGYSLEASRKIGLTEAGFIPVDEEYNGLIED